ncbi:MAG: hypothetical protein GF390_01620 [Candidatus Pacebacteria bacterium]|nr:hypothetical protein [Candidatus Paceibacterota bacterium]
MQHKFFALIGSLLISLQLLVWPVFAAQEQPFQLDLHTNYTINDQGQAYVEHQFTITNLTATTYLNKYGLKIGSENLTNIHVVDQDQIIKPEIVKANGYTSIGITFANELVGEGKQRQFSISYQNPDVAIISGQVLEVVIPQQTNPEAYQQYTVNLTTPARFGPPTRVTPSNYQLQQNNTAITTQFTNLQKQGISAIFGTEQFFHFNLRYHLENPTNQQALTQISLIPDTPYQRVNYQALDPLPSKIAADADGNWIATYRLAANSNLEVNLAVQVKRTLTANPHIPVNPVLPNHTQADQYWPVNDSAIKTIAEQQANAQSIYQYTVNTLQYTTADLSQGIKRLGALKALAQPNQATCQEFTDLFVTLARAQHIPARRITGYAYAENSSLRPLSLVKDVLHTWPQYYQQQQNTWVNIDPTWGHTTKGVDYFNQFDLNHVVFAINGQDSTLPLPAGAYKLNGGETKDIEAEFTDQFDQVSPQLSVQLTSKKIAGWSIPGSYLLTLQNHTGQAWYELDLWFDWQNPNQSLKLKLNQDKLKAHSDGKSTHYQLKMILPFETLTIPLSSYNEQQTWPTTNSVNLTIKTSAHSQQHELKITSQAKLQQLFSQPVGLAILAASFILVPLTAGSLLILKRRS